MTSNQDMQQFDNDMEELFRRAAEKYPLDATGADWSKVQQGLQSHADAVAEKKDDRRKFLLLLLLLPVVLLGYQLLKNSGIGVGASEDNKVAQSPTVKFQITESTAPKIESVHTRPSENNTGSTMEHVPASLPQVKRLRQSVDLIVKNGYVITGNTMGDGNVNPQKPEMKLVKGVDDPDRPSKVVATDLLYPLHPGATVGFDLSPKTSLQTFNPSLPTGNEEDKNTKRFYVGVYASVDATTVKFQKVEGAGFGYGVLLGYQVRKSWSVEAGVSYVKKAYYSDGKSFNTSRVYVPSNAKITEVEGDCRMIELPVAIRYNVKQGKKSSLFATVGVTSYLMQKEEYGSTYYYPYANPPYSKQYYKEYRNSGNYVASNLLLTGGYTRPIGKIADIRIEPYVKIPLRGVGIGALPLTSAGIHLGVTRKIF